MQIDYLANRLNFLEPLAKLHLAEWGYLYPVESLEQRVVRLRAACGCDGVPSVFVGFDGDRLIGSAALVEDDMETDGALTPWLAAVFVVPEQRGNGYAAQLIERVEAEAGAAGYSQIYLYTPGAEAYYQRSGWRTREQTTFHGAAVTVMQKRLSP